MRISVILALVLLAGCGLRPHPDDVATVADLNRMGDISAEVRPAFERAHGLNPRAQAPGIIRRHGVSYVDHDHAVIYVSDQDDYYGLVAEWYYLPDGYEWLRDKDRDRVWRGLFLEYERACKALQ